MPFDDYCALIKVEEGGNVYYDIHLYRTGDSLQRDLDELADLLIADYQKKGKKARLAGKFSGEVIDDVVTPDLARHWASHGGTVQVMAYVPDGISYMKRDEIIEEAEQAIGDKIMLLYWNDEDAKRISAMDLPNWINLGRATEEHEVLIIRYDLLGAQNLVTDLHAAAKIYNGKCAILADELR